MTSGPLDPRLTASLEREPLSAESRAVGFAIAAAVAAFFAFALWASGLQLDPPPATPEQRRAALGCPPLGPGEVHVITITVRDGREHIGPCATYRGRGKL